MNRYDRFPRCFTPTGVSMRYLLAVALFALLGSACAQSPLLEPKGSRINLDARASEEVDNDVMRATLFVEMEDGDASKLAERFNQANNDALETAKGFGRLLCRKSGYSTYPVTDMNEI